MAKKKAAKSAEIQVTNEAAPSVNKSELVRTYMAANPNDKPKAVSEALSAQGHVISPAFVSQIKVNQKKKGGAPVGKRGRKAATPSANGSGIGSQLNAAVALIAACGGVEQAKEVLSAVGRLKSSVPF